MMEENERVRSLFDIEALEATRTLYLDAGNAEFEDEAGCLYLVKDGQRRRVLLHLLFPYNSRTEFISVLDIDYNEVGEILDINCLTEEGRSAVDKELKRKYYVRKIKKIIEIKDRHGITTWKVKTEGDGEPIEFTLRDTYGSMFKITETRIIITDMDGNRFEIENVKNLDGGSYRKIELYL